ncbi:acylneuraminate cytidylyltransferase family protein [uncultured Desulfosarcina sp.]|uniref:acylneuraminate cytidylyltransferase family protein n=1 Tax=uncultured Desulfosarcina sp. TaxID=218289 RepID=UPI0029C848A9|nr:acylneuraminate cytidylyltransferase family protein [uncultured Desulfosarcina sp.]
MKKPKVLCVIPARGGSKRLPRKNIKILVGLPLIAYTIKAVQNCHSVTDYLVSSEDEEILEYAKKYGAPVPFVRPKKLSEDNVRNIDVIYHALKFMENYKNCIYDIIVLLQPTCPIRNPMHIDQAVSALVESNLNTVVSVKGPYKKRDPILKAIRDGEIVDYCDVKDPNDIEPFYLYNASIYAVKRDYFVKHKKLISSRQIPLVMDAFHSVDIDTEADFILAEAYIKYLKKMKG